MTYDSLRSQCSLLLLASLAELGGRGTRLELLEHIAARSYFNLEAEDMLPFPTALQPEPRWELLMALAWTTCSEAGCIVEIEANRWQLTPDGEKFYSRATAQFRDGVFDAHRCFLWTEQFKRRLMPGYVRAPHERPRPPRFYHDIQRQLTALSAA